jgi:hypothetical protein
MSTRPSLRSTSSGRLPGNAPNSRVAGGLAAPPSTAHPRQNSIRTYFSPLSQNTSVNSQTPSSKVDAAGSLGARKARSHHDLARPSSGATHRDPLKPPTNSSVTHPPTAQFQTTNGLRAPLLLAHDEPTSEASTPRPDSLDDATPKPAGSTSKETRTLRSKDGGSRLKSGLSIYFANYDDIITDAPKSPGVCLWRALLLNLIALTLTEILTPNEPIYIFDDSVKAPGIHTPTDSRHISVPSRPKPSPSATHVGVPLVLPNTPNNAKTIPLSAIPPSLAQPASDPLSDSLFFKPHRRAERKEKQLRNIEKERAMHEKVQLERLLEGLKGPDWLRVMGVTGITEGDQKDWKPKRDYFISEVDTLVEKFRLWKEEEKRLRLEKERAREEEEEDDDEDEDDGMDKEDDGGADSSDIDASAARQLQLEAGLTPKTVPRRKPKPIEAFVPPSPEGPFVSFYSKPHMRAAAMGSSRHGRNVTAFGRPIPDFEEHEFALPDDYITPDAIRANARKRRRMNRELKENVND